MTHDQADCTATPGRRGWTIAIILVAIIGIILRWIGLSRQSLWYDEGYTAWMVSHPASEIIRLVRADTAPPLYYLLLHEWTLVFGRSEFALRSMSTGCASMAIPLVILVARNLLTMQGPGIPSTPGSEVLRRPGSFPPGIRVVGVPPNPAWEYWMRGQEPAVLIATILISFSLMQVQYAKEARTYSLISLLVITAFFAIQQRVAGRGWIWAAAAAIAISAGMYSHNIMVMYAIGLALAWLVMPGTQSLSHRIRDVSITAICVGLIYLPWGTSLASQVRAVDQHFWIAPPTAQSAAEVFAPVAGVGWCWTYMHVLPEITWRMTDCTILSIIVSLAIIGILISAGTPHTTRRATAALAAVGLLPMLLAFEYSCVRSSIFIDKIFLPSGAVIPILIALPLTTRRRSALACVTAGGFILLSMLSLGGFIFTEHKEDWRSAAGFVEALAPAHRLIVFVGNDGELPFDYYFHPKLGDVETGLPQGFFDIDPPRTMRRVLTDRDVRPLAMEIDSKRFDQIVVVLTHAGWTDPENRTLRLLRNRWLGNGQHDFAQVGVYVFIRP